MYERFGPLARTVALSSLLEVGFDHILTQKFGLNIYMMGV